MSNKGFGPNLDKIQRIVQGRYEPEKTSYVMMPRKTDQPNEGEMFTKDGVEMIIENGTEIPYIGSKKNKWSDEINPNARRCECGLQYGYMNHTDQKMFRMTGRCLHCQTKYEDLLKAQGKYQEYERNIMQANAKALYKDAQQMAQEYIRDLKRKQVEVVCNEYGELETWEQPDRSEEIDNVLGQLQDLEEEVKNMESSDDK